MGAKDISEKILLDYNDVFADVINVCAFDGNEIIKANDLQNRSVHSEYKAEDGKIHEEERDIAKYWKRKRSAIAPVASFVLYFGTKKLSRVGSLESVVKSKWTIILRYFIKIHQLHEC